jgi:hypothetical protein
MLLVLSAAPTSAQAPFLTGQTVAAEPGDPDTACTTQAALDRYISAQEMCGAGEPDECQVVRDLEARGSCGFHYGRYVVTSTDPQLGWIQISPTSDPTLVLWADARDFRAAD